MDETDGRNGKDEQTDVNVDAEKIKKYLVPVHKILNKTWWFLCLGLVIFMFIYLGARTPDPLPGFDENGDPTYIAGLSLGSDISPYFNIEDHFTKICEGVTASLMNVMIAFLIIFMVRDLFEFLINGWGDLFRPKTKKFLSFCLIVSGAMVDVFMKFIVCAYIILYWGA